MKGQNANKRYGKDWWGKRPLSGIPVSNNKGMKFWKRLLHKIERREARQEQLDFIDWTWKHQCKYVKREGESCTLNNNCTYPNCK